MQTKLIIKTKTGQRWHEIAVRLHNVQGLPVVNVKGGTASSKAMFASCKHYSKFDRELDLTVDGQWSPFYGDVTEIVIDVEHSDTTYPLVIANSWEHKE